MKISVTFTLMSKDDNEELLIEETKILIELIKKQFKDNNINILKIGVGIHKNAERLHTHTSIVMAYEGKELKHLDKKFATIIKYKNKDYDLKKSIYRETDAKYRDDLGTQYCLKEYENFDEIILKDYFIGFNDDEIEQLRAVGNAEYQKAVKQRQRDAERKKMEEDETLQLFEFIHKKILGDASPYDKCDFLETHTLENEHLPSIKDRLRFVKLQVLLFYKERGIKTGRVNFKAYSVRDKAVNFMTRYCSESILCDLVDLI